MTSFPKPLNPNGAPDTPGYRILGIDEQFKIGDEVWMPSKHWGPMSGDAIKNLNGTHLACAYRRALCVDDPYAPPVDQWSIEGWIVSGPVRGDQSELAQVGEETWNPSLKQWIRACPNIGYCVPVYVRRKVKASASSTPKAPNQSIVINIHDSEVLSRAVQELAFGAGWGWGRDDKTHRTNLLTFYPHGVAISLDANGKTMGYSPISFYRSKMPEAMFLDAKTDMGQLIDLLAALKVPPAPVAPQPPTVNGYVAQYHRGPPGTDLVNTQGLVSFGCAALSVSMLRFAETLMTTERPGNRKVASIVLDSGVKLTKDDVKRTLAYIDQVNGDEISDI